MDGGEKLKNWIIVAHPWAWSASMSPAIVAYSFIFFLFKTEGYIGEVNWIYGVIGFFGMLIFHISGNLMNEYQDYINGVDVKEKTGPPRLIVQGIFKPKTILYYSLTMLTIGVLIGTYLLINTSWPLLIIGLIGILSVIFYHKFKYVALGELLIYICYAMAVPMGIAFVITGQLIWTTLLVAAPTGLLVVGILHANNTRDVNQDGGAKVSTQAMKLGLEGSQIVYQTLLLVAYLLIAVLVTINLLHPITFLVLISFPLAKSNIKKMKIATERDLSSIAFLDARTSMLSLMFSLLLAIANVIAPYI
ncbi:MAG: 1,4-dihydroxy-2-naphthoate octaprenyltransferase [Bacteroidales bacterium]|nr:1,4-dihydroxy-2-naphthoate octaprenyltransferase [Bacteroidales bacterium]